MPENAILRPLEGYRILLAEDELIIGMLLEDVVERLGGSVAAVTKSCAEALTCLQAGGVDGVVLDVHLKGGTSEAVLQAADVAAIPVLVSSGLDAAMLPAIFQERPLLRKPWLIEDAELAVATLIVRPTS